MGNSQKICSLASTVNQSSSAEIVGRHFLGRQVNNELQQSLPDEKRGEQQFIRIKTITYNQDTYSVFDYQSNDIKKAIFKIRSSGSLVFAREHVCFRRKNLYFEDPGALIGINQEVSELIPPQNELFKIRKKKEFGRFYLQQSLDADRKPTKQSNWVVVKSVQKKLKTGFQLFENDYIRLGRLNFKVREICESGKQASSVRYCSNEFVQVDIFFVKQINKIIEEQTVHMSEEEPTEILTQMTSKNLTENVVSNQTNLLNNVLQTNQSNTKNLQGGASTNLQQKDKMEDLQQDTEPESTICRICLSEQTDKDNPLVNPCKCTGSMKFVHIKCIQSWIRSKIQGLHSNSNCQNLLSQFFKCDVCKMKLHFKVTSEGKIFDIVDISKPEDGSPYLILEDFNENMQFIGVFILRLGGKNTFTIGRSSKNDFNFAEISLSRKHAELIYNVQSNQLFLKDKDSKFGSLVLMRDDLEISIDLQNVQIQNGRTLVELLPEKSSHGILSSYFGRTGENKGIEEFSDKDNQHNSEINTQDF